MSEQPTTTPAPETAAALPTTDHPTPGAPATAQPSADVDEGKGGKGAILRELAEERDKRQAMERELQPLRDTVGRLQSIFGGDKQPEGEDIVQSLQQRVQQMERDSLVNTVARRHGLTNEEDVAFLRVAPDEEAMSRLAERLKAPSTTTPTSPAPDPSQGAASPTPEAIEEAEYAAFYPPTGK